MVDLVVIALVAVLICTPCLATLWMGTGCRRALWRAGYSNWVICCDRLIGDDLDLELERGDQPPRPIAAYFTRMPPTRERQQSRLNGLRLATWREDVLRHASKNTPITAQLEHIQIKAESMERDEPHGGVVAGNSAPNATERQTQRPHTQETTESAGDPPSSGAPAYITVEIPFRSNETRTAAPVGIECICHCLGSRCAHKKLCVPSHPSDYPFLSTASTSVTWYSIKSASRLLVLQGTLPDTCRLRSTDIGPYSYIDLTSLPQAINVRFLELFLVEKLTGPVTCVNHGDEWSTEEGRHVAGGDPVSSLLILLSTIMEGLDPAMVAKYLVVALLCLLVVSPCIAILWKGTHLRRSLWRAGCWRWVICCDVVYGEGVSSADFMERGDGALTVEAYYQLLFADQDQQTSTALRLTTWREDLREHMPAGLVTRLQEIKIHNERIDREEPLILPQRVAFDAHAATKQHDREEQSEYTAPPIVSTTSGRDGQTARHGNEENEC